MGGVSKVGSNFVVAFSLPKSQNPDTDGYMLVNAPSVREFKMTFALNAMPYGHAVCTLNQVSDIPVDGTYGTMIVQDYDREGKSDLVFSIYISGLVQRQLTTTSVQISFDFQVGSKEADLKMKNFACTGTSSVAMQSCVREAGLTSVTRYTDNGRNTDTMTWRLVNGNFEENMNYVVSHSYIPSDILFWTLDENTGKIVISTFNTEKSSKTRSICFYSQDAMVSTKEAVFKPNGMAGTSVYRYQSMDRVDYTSKWRSAMFPNLIVDTTTNKGIKETGDCGGECLEVVMNTAGAGSVPPGLKPPKNSTGVYGDPTLAMAFPQNGHKKYAVADTIRARLLSEYGRTARVRIFNHFGPPVGSCVYLVANNLLIREGELTPDVNYTARYIVMNKLVNKISSTTTGVLGSALSTMTNEYETILELGTNFPYSKDPSREYVIVMDAVKQVMETVESKK